MCVHESPTIQNRAFDRTFVGVSMLANNAKSGNWCRLPSPSFSSRCARMKVVPRWFPDLRQIVPRFATKESRHIPIACEIRSYQEYELGYRKLATALGRASSKPAPRELELLRLLIGRRTNPVGSLGLADCLFMTAFVSIIRPCCFSLSHRPTRSKCR